MLHDEYHVVKAERDAAFAKYQELEARFIPIQQAFLANREQTVPTEIWQHIASFCDMKSRLCLAACSRHLHDEVMFGKYAHVWVWRYNELYIKQHYSPMKAATQLSKTDTLGLMLLKSGVNTDGTNDLNSAINRGFVRLVEAMLNIGVQLDERSMYFAVPCGASNNVDMMTLILSRIASYEPSRKRRYLECTDTMMSPMEISCREGKLVAVKLLVEAGACITTYTLKLAVGHGYIDIAKYLLERDSLTINARGNLLYHVCVETTYFQYSFETRLEMIKLLLAFGADPNMPMEYYHNGMSTIESISNYFDSHCDHSCFSRRHEVLALLYEHVINSD